MSKKIVIGADHGAFELKAKIIEHLTNRGFAVNNMGVDSYNSVDYPDMAEKTCKEYLSGNYDFGIVCCGTGIGISISANKVNGIRCALPQNIFGAEMSKVHNNANFIAFGGRIEYQDSVTDMVDAFIDAKFEGGRHQRRVDKIMGLE
ncbi:MAG: ribose 5-phosphate isomerase B [Spirochaetales bacterium]|nr:ribose 5-phosphate isomerase B [Spirochaetales bacterium]